MYECRSLFDHYLPILSSLHEKMETIEPTKVELYETNFLSDEVSWIWKSADIIYACATCFAEKQMKELLDRLSTVSPGTILILLDKEIICDKRSGEAADEDYNSSSVDGFAGYFCYCSVERPSGDGNGATEKYIVNAFEYLDFIHSKTTWGEAYAYVYRKIAV